MIDVEEFEDCRVSLFATMILERFDVNAGAIVLAEPRGNLDAAVYQIVVFHESADEPNNDYWGGRSRLSGVCGEAHGGGLRVRHRERKKIEERANRQSRAKFQE